MQKEHWRKEKGKGGRKGIIVNPALMLINLPHELGVLNNKGAFFLFEIKSLIYILWKEVLRGRK